MYNYYYSMVHRQGRGDGEGSIDLSSQRILSRRRISQIRSWKGRKEAVVPTNTVEALDKPDRNLGSRKGVVVSTNIVEATDKPDRKLEKQKGSSRLNKYSRGDG